MADEVRHRQYGRDRWGGAGAPAKPWAAPANTTFGPDVEGYGETIVASMYTHHVVADYNMVQPQCMHSACIQQLGFPPFQREAAAGGTAFSDLQ